MRLRSNLHPAMYRLRDRFGRLYGEHQKDLLTERLNMMFGRYGLGYGPLSDSPRWSEKSTVLITYADMIRGEKDTPLMALKRFADKRLQGMFSAIHILPFAPYSSDDGFSVIDYRKVNPEFGTWGDIGQLNANFDLMFDLVLNHCSRESRWFKDFLNGIAPERHYFHAVEPSADLSMVVRPRSLPLLTPYQTINGLKHIWTTFSDDQVDLNFSNADVLFEFLDILMLYVHYGARMIRLDAIAFLWKQIGTNCLHLPETHEVVKVFRDFLEMLAPEVILVTETNVPHEENISYFGKGDEAHMVYQFPLPPLLLHALLRGSGKVLTEWAAGLATPPAGCTFFNFTASHDGIGVRPLEGLLPQEEIDRVVENVRERGGRINTRRLSDGTDKPYELNITYFDALADPANASASLHIARFICSQTIMVALQGIPGVYFHSITGTRNWTAGVEQSGHNRTINRRKWSEIELREQLGRGSSTTARVFKAYSRLLSCRRANPAFHPESPQTILHLGDELFALQRESIHDGRPVVCLHNLTAATIHVQLTSDASALDVNAGVFDLLGEEPVDLGNGALTLAPYQCRWLTSQV